MSDTPIRKSGNLKGLLLMGLLGLCLAWGVNQWVVGALETKAEDWAPSQAAEILPRPEAPKPAQPVELAPGIIEEQVLAPEEGPKGRAALDLPDEAQTTPQESAPSAPSKQAQPKDSASPEKSAEKKKPAIPTRVFTADRKALKTQFKKPSDLYAHGHYLPNEEDGVRRGLRFAAVAPGGVFAQFGLKRGDIVLSVNGAPLNNQNDVLANFEKMRTMSVLNMRLERDGKLLKHRYIFK